MCQSTSNITRIYEEKNGWDVDAESEIKMPLLRKFRGSPDTLTDITKDSALTVDAEALKSLTMT